MAQNSHLSTLSTGFSTCGNLFSVYNWYNRLLAAGEKIPLAFYIVLCVWKSPRLPKLQRWAAGLAAKTWLQTVAKRGVWCYTLIYMREKP
ncbi:hypothetical protein [Allofournierella massiliensis]|uniref:hypothetical protein n=1 Tax=Allofournierella massiliensis TaxID=1650663 RepID=UPI0039A01282